MTLPTAPATADDAEQLAAAVLRLYATVHELCALLGDELCPDQLAALERAFRAGTDSADRAPFMSGDAFLIAAADLRAGLNRVATVRHLARHRAA